MILGFFLCHTKYDCDEQHFVIFDSGVALSRRNL